jgi:hypothetical protein
MKLLARTTLWSIPVSVVAVNFVDDNFLPAYGLFVATLCSLTLVIVSVWHD